MICNLYGIENAMMNDLNACVRAMHLLHNLKSTHFGMPSATNSEHTRLCLGLRLKIGLRPLV